MGAAEALLEHIELQRAQRGVKRDALVQMASRLPELLDRLVEIALGNVTREVATKDGIVELRVAPSDQIRAIAEIAKIMGVYTDAPQVKVAVGADPFGPEEFDGRDPVMILVRALELSSGDEGSNARLARLLERLAQDADRVGAIETTASPAS